MRLLGGLRGVRRRAGLCAFMLASGALFVGVPTASGSTDDKPHALGPVEPTAELMRQQLELDRAAEGITSAAAADAQDNLAGVAVEPENNALVVYWKGDVSASVTQAIASTRTRGMEVRVASAKYSLADLKAHASAIFSEETKAALPERSRARLVAPLPDGSGLKVTSGQRDRAVESARAARHPVVDTVAGDVEALTRLDDTSPYWGGSRIIIHGGGSCSTAFGVHWGSSPVNYGMLTAGHCGDLLGGAGSGGPNSLVYNGAGTAMGTVGGLCSAACGSDTMVINIRSGASSGTWVYDGAYNNASNYAKPVVGQAASFKGDWVCTSGSYSGVRCNMRVTNPNAYPGGQSFRVVEVATVDGSNAAGKGDSGGSVFALATNTSQVIAKGLISSADKNTLTTCTGVTGTRTCYATIYYVSIADALNTFHISLNLY